MKIKEVKLKNFKFHQNLEFKITKQNCLLYGENGTGKSSIYEALYSVFNIYFRDKTYSFNKFKNNNSVEALNTKVILDDETELVIPQTTYKLVNTITINNKKTIYFANQDLLESIISNDNFYDTVKKSFKHTFASLHNFRKNFEYINSRINSLNYLDEDAKRKDNIIKMEIFLNQIELRANDIINNHFEEKFTINFEYDWGLSNTEDDFKYPHPKIILKIDDEKNLKLNFNEAKLKLSSIAIFFALIKLEEDTNNPLKLLVLDDFLTSLDMANRKLIVQYILENFGDYQKIILTHNIQFYNLIVKFLKSRKNNEQKEELTDWDIKNIFLFKENNHEIALIKENKVNYLYRAKKELKRGEFHSSGNFSRKEFERITNEFKQILEIGKQEQFKHILDILKSDNDGNKFYKKPFSVLTKLNDRYTNISNILENQDNSDAKIGKIKFEIKQMREVLKLEECELSSLKNLLVKTEFYKNILFNPASHNHEEIEIYRKECLNGIELLAELNIVLENLK